MSAEQFYNKYKDEVEIKFCLDNNREKQNKKFHGVSIYSPYIKDISKYKIVVSSIHYFAIAKQLKKMGLEEFKNFIPDSIFRCKGKELALIHGNCHTLIIQAYLMWYKSFSSRWVFFQIPRICEFNNFGLNFIDESVLKSCSLFLYQNISDQYQKLSTSYLLSKVKDNCLCLKLSNTYGHAEGFFPQVSLDYNINKNRLFPYGDKNITQFINRNYSVDRIIYKLKNENIYSKDIVYENLNNQFNVLERKEHDCNIKIVDYIKSMYKKQKLFYEPFHPTNFLLKEVTRRILKYLNIYFEDFETVDLYANFGNLGQCEIPIYPCVSKHLGLEFESGTGRVPCDEFENQELSFDRYVRAYIKYCYGIT